MVAGQRPVMPPVNARIPQMIQGAIPNGPGKANIQGDMNGAGRLARPLLNSPGAFGGFMSQPPEDTVNIGAPRLPPTGRSSFQTSPAVQNDPLYRSMEQQQRNFGLRDLNQARWQPNVDELNRQADVVQNTMPPDVNDPSFQPITPQQAFLQIPGNNYAQMRDRFNRIAANRPPTEPPMTAQQPTSTMPNYAQRYAAAEAENIAKNPEYTPVDANGPAYRIENGQVVPRGSITPLPRVGGQLTPEEFRRMQAVGSSVGEWEKKSQWLKQKYPGYTGEMTPEQAQAYTAEQQKLRLDRNDMIHQNKMNRIAQAEQIRNAKSKQAGQLYQRNNPQLFTTPDFTAAQLQYGLATGNLQGFQNPGLTPQQAMAAQLQNDQNQVQLIQQEPDPEKRARMIEAYQRSKQFGGGGVGGIPNGPPMMGGGMGSSGPASSDSYNRNEQGQLQPGRMAGKISSIVSNPNATPQDLINEGINQYTLAELENGLRHGIFSDPAETTAMKDLIRRAREILGRQGQAASGQGAAGQAAGQGGVPLLPPAVPPFPGSDGRWGNPYGPSF